MRVQMIFSSKEELGSALCVKWSLQDDDGDDDDYDDSLAFI